MLEGVRQYVRLDASCHDLVKNVVLLRRDTIKRDNKDIIDDPPAKKLKLTSGSRSAQASSVKDFFSYLRDGADDHTMIMPAKKKGKGKITPVPFGAKVIYIPSLPKPESSMDQLD